MKTSAYIFSTLIILLFAQPLLSLEGSSQKDMLVDTDCCCTKNDDCNKPEREEKRDDCNALCNPFMCCSSCVYLVCESPVLSLPLTNHLSLDYSHSNNFYISNYQAECWHPPEIVV